MDATAEAWVGSLSQSPSGGGFPVSRLPFKVVSLKFHNHEFQGYSSRNKHHHQVKAQMTFLMVPVKPGVREEKAVLRIRSKKVSGAARSVLAAQQGM